MLVVAVMAVAGCGGSGTTQNTSAGTRTEAPGVSASDGTAAAPDASQIDAAAIARTNEVIAMPDAERDAALFDAGMQLELDVAHESGLEAALGGREQAQAALEAAWAPVLGQAQTIDGSSMSLGLRRRASTVPEIGEGMFGASLVITLTADAFVTQDFPAGPPISEDQGNGVVLSGSQNSSSVSLNTSHTDSETGVTTKLETQSTVVPCPDVNGSFDASGLMDVTVTKGDAGQHGTLDVQVVGQVDDDARLVSSDMEFQMQWSKSGGGSSQFVDVSVSIPSSGDAVASVNRTGGAVTAELERSAMIGGMLYAMLMQNALVKAAQKGWESGRCVRLDVTPNPALKDMDPSSTADITAAPRSKIDGGPAGGTVMATLVDGGSGVDPNATSLPADASFVYTAHPEPFNHGTVKLEARSKRGVAKAELTFETTSGFTASGSSEGVTFTGTVTSLTEPFTIDISFPGSESGSFTFDGSSDTGGAVIVSAEGGGAVVSGSGSYTVTDNGDGTKTVTATVHSCVTVSGECRDGVHPILLTPRT